MTQSTRRQFLRRTGTGAAAAAFGFQVVPSRVFGANDRITLAGIGTGGKGASDIANSASAGFEVIALCDVVDITKLEGRAQGRMGSLSGTRGKFPKANFYTDWREMLEKEPDIDGVTVSTPDHMHAHASIAAMKKGKHVYTQKPLSHGIWEARKMLEVARESGVKTQMGNQAHALESMRTMVEMIRAGLIGKVTEVHTWTNRPIWPQGMKAYPKPEPVPAHIDWDLWVGPAQDPGYSPEFMPFKWRGWWEFGCGALGDMACHIMDMSYWALELGAPTSVVVEQEGASDVACPNWSTITYQFPARGAQPEVKYVWYDGKRDGKANVPPEDVLEGQNPTEGKGFGTVMIGEKGKVWFNRGKANWITKPDSLVADLGQVTPSLARARDEDPHKEWYDAIAAGGTTQALSNFEYAAPFTEMVLLGNLAVRIPKKLEWDAASLSCPNAPEAAPLIKRSYREGWELPA